MGHSCGCKPKTLDDLENDLVKLSIKIRKRTTKTVNQMAEQLQKEMIKNVSVVDEHTPKWLKNKGHPYSTLSPSLAPIPHRGIPIVHRQPDPKRGKYSNIHLSDNIKIFKGDRKDELRVGVSKEDVPYIDYIINGTPKGQMISRDFLSYSLLKLNKRFRKKVAKNFKAVMKEKGKLNNVVQKINLKQG